MKEIIEKDKSGYEEMDIESAELIEVLTNTKGKRKGGTVNMCKAFEDHYKSGKMDLEWLELLGMMKKYLLLKQLK